MKFSCYGMNFFLSYYVLNTNSYKNLATSYKYVAVSVVFVLVTCNL